MFVQFSDASNEKIISCFSCQQDSSTFPNQGIVEVSDARWATYYASLPGMAQQVLPAPTN